MMRSIYTATALVALFAASPGHAVQRLEAPFVLGTHYEQSGGNTCSNINACKIAFAAPPAGRTLNVRQVACSIQTRPNGIGQVLLSTERPGFSGFPRALPLQALTQSVTKSSQGDVYFSAVSDQTFSYPVTGPTTITAFLSIGAVSNNLLSLTCQISGTLSPPA